MNDKIFLAKNKFEQNIASSQSKGKQCKLYRWWNPLKKKLKIFNGLMYLDSQEHFSLGEARGLVDLKVNLVLPEMIKFICK